jgi:hypothetical protein
VLLGVLGFLREHVRDVLAAHGLSTWSRRSRSADQTLTPRDAPVGGWSFRD